MSDSDEKRRGLFGRIGDRVGDFFSEEGDDASESDESLTPRETQTSRNLTPSRRLLNIRRVEPHESRSAPESSSAPAPTESATPSPPTPIISSEELLRRAARCYAEAGLVAEVTRLYVQTNDNNRLARFYEEQGQWQLAGDCYRRLNQWLAAARCYEQAQLWAVAADCWLQMNDRVRAAWIWVDRAGDWFRSETLLNDFEPRTDGEHHARELVIARCDAQQREFVWAARRLQTVLPQITPTTDPELIRWSTIIAERINRPDLRAIACALAVQANLPDADGYWGNWQSNGEEQSS